MRPRPAVLDYWPDLSRWDGLLNVQRKGDLVLIGYTERCTFERKWDEVTRQCRGLIFRDSTREVLAWPFSKFFNLGEQPETMLDALPDCNFYVSEKLDGALGIMYRDEDGQLAIATRGSFRSHEAEWATEWLREWLTKNEDTFDTDKHTYLFEICAPLEEFFHVAMKAPGLYLIGMRDLESGNEFTPPRIQGIAESIGMECARPLPSSIPDLLKMAETIKATECEGFVLHYENGLKVKIKGEDYRRIARFLQTLSAKHVFECVRDGTAQVPEGIPAKYADRFQELAHQVTGLFNATVRESEEAWIQAGRCERGASREERKEFASNLFAIRWPTSIVRSLAFDRINGQNSAEKVFDAMQRAKVWQQFDKPLDESMRQAASI